MEYPPYEQTPGQGPDFDVMDQIIQNLQNISSFLSRIEDEPVNPQFIKNQLPKILSIRKEIFLQIEMLAQEPYNYSHAHLTRLKKENEKIFLNLEGAVGARDQSEFKKFASLCGDCISQFDNDLTP